jgi:hypothetical protein
MKKTLKTLFALCTFLIVYKANGQQNGGQSAESNSLKIELNGISPNYQAIIKVTNKQNCTAGVRFDHNSTTRTKTIASLSSDTFMINLPECGVKVKPLTNCGGGIDMGWVELNVCEALPVKFMNIQAKRIDAQTIQLYFESEEDNTIREYRVKLSFDGKTYQTVTVLFPNGIEGKKQYVVTIKIPQKP